MNHKYKNTKAYTHTHTHTHTHTDIQKLSYSTVAMLLLKHDCHNLHFNSVKASDKSEKEDEGNSSQKPLCSSSHYVDFIALQPMDFDNHLYREH